MSDDSSYFETTAIGVVIPALNEEEAIQDVILDIPDWVNEIIVADNGSTDHTGEKAREAGARIVHEPRRGYGAACQAGVAALQQIDIVVFLDGDYSDDPTEMDKLVRPIIEKNADFVIGSRKLGDTEKGALAPQARWGNALACFLIRIIWRHAYSDLGPFRAIRMEDLRALDMRDRDYGWTVEMQIKAIQKDLTIREVPVHYRNRIGRSKITGTVSGVLGAGCKILWTIFYYSMSEVVN